MNALYRTFILCALTFSASAFADWSLDDKQSSVNFVSVKKDSVGEVHQFKQLSGNIAVDGSATLLIDLASVDSGIAIRDERMRKFLFETTKFATAEIKVKFPAKVLASMKTGDIRVLDVDATMSLHGKSVEKTWPLTVFKTKAGGVRVLTHKPVLINAADFDLTGGIAKLKELAALPSIATSVPVTVDLSFSEKTK
ncbi:YceI family protein [Teredinibacter turnerae]|uniref:YceI family protein n=1 Tax=Teredinibacter turnerae TaxID=2426 RepID=UPI000363B256|nr:YceI family protein [Teredinibacter turnerae]